MRERFTSSRAFRGDNVVLRDKLSRYWRDRPQFEAVSPRIFPCGDQRASTTCAGFWS